MDTRFSGITEFVATTRLGSFTAAAKELGLTKSAVGRAISRLEARLGSKLLHRTTRRLVLTPAGEAWRERCVAALAELERGETELTIAQDAPCGDVRIDLPTAFGRLVVVPVLLELADRYPALRFNMSFTDRRVDLVGEGIDLSVRIGDLRDSPQLIARQVGVQHMMIVGESAYIEKRGLPRSAADLAKHDCIVGRRQGHDAEWLLRGADGTVAVCAVPAKHEVQDFEAVLQVVRSGQGLAQLPAWMVKSDIRAGRLLPVLEGMSGGDMPISILWPPSRTLPAKVRVVIDGLIAGLGAAAR